MPNESILIDTVRKLSSTEIEQLIEKRKVEDKALRALLRVAITREREERRLTQEAVDA
jgi:hypothetical protein